MDKVLVNVRNKPLKKSLPDTLFLLKMTLIQICELLVVIVYRNVTQMNTHVMHGDAYNMKKHIHEYPHRVQHCAVRCFVRCPIQFLHPCQRTWRLENCNYGFHDHTFKELVIGFQESYLFQASFHELYWCFVSVVSCFFSNLHHPNNVVISMNWLIVTDNKISLPKGGRSEGNHYH